MRETAEYYLVRASALPEVLQKVVQVRQLLDANPGLTVQTAAEKAGLSRSSYYKYKDDVQPFFDNTIGKTITLVIQTVDTLGIISKICTKAAEHRANILTIHQSVPVNGIATLSLSLEIRENTFDIRKLIGEIEEIDNVQHVQLVGQS